MVNSEFFLFLMKWIENPTPTCTRQESDKAVMNGQFRTLKFKKEDPEPWLPPAVRPCNPLQVPYGYL